MFKAVFLDIDNTILDFDKCADASMKHAAYLTGLPYEPHWLDTFTRINDSLWREIENGTLTREGLRLVRWNRIFAALGIDFDGVAFEKLFSGELFRSAELVDGAGEAVARLARKYKLFAVSNAMQDQQITRLTNAGLISYFTDVYTSERVGAQKPTRAFFDECFSLCGLGREEAVMVGDSLTADVGGALDYGIAVIWFNRKSEPLPDGVVPDRVIRSLRELRDVL